MSHPVSFQDFNKNANDLLGKVFPKKGVNSWGVELELKPTRYQTFSGKINNVGGASNGEVSAEVNVTDFGLTFKTIYKTEKPSLEFSAKISDRIPVDGLSAKVHFDASSDHQCGGVSVAYEHKFVNFNSRIHIPITVQLLDFAKEIKVKDTRLEGDISLAHPDHKFILGGSSKISFPDKGERKVDEYSVSVGYREGKLFNPTVTYKQVNGKDKEGKPEETKTVSAVATSQPADTQYVAAVDYVVGTRKTTVTLGLQYPLDDGAVVKAKLNSNKEAGLAYSKSLSASSKLDFGTLFVINTDDKVKVDSSFNFNLKFVQ